MPIAGKVPKDLPKEPVKEISKELSKKDFVQAIVKTVVEAPKEPVKPDTEKVPPSPTRNIFSAFTFSSKKTEEKKEELAPSLQ